MKRRIFCTVLSLLLLLSACGSPAPAPEPTEPAEIAETTPAKQPEFVPAPMTVIPEASVEKKQDPGDLPRDPGYSFHVDEMLPSDFGDFFTEDHPCTRSSYLLLEGNYFENEVTVISGAEPGPAIYVIAGVHGDEEAAWQAGKLLKKASIRAGTLYILAPANRWGAAAQPKTRYVEGKLDLNRSFPGKANGNDAERVANAIYTDVKEKQPDFVFDLHEATVVSESRDYLGSSLIFTDLSLCEELFFDLLFATQDGTICSRPFNYYSPGPAGSVNSSISTGLTIPVITVETFRGYPMEERIGDQLDVVHYTLQYYGMI